MINRQANKIDFETGPIRIMYFRRFCGRENI